MRRISPLCIAVLACCSRAREADPGETSPSPPVVAESAPDPDATPHPATPPAAPPPAAPTTRSPAPPAAVDVAVDAALEDRLHRCRRLNDYDEEGPHRDHNARFHVDRAQAVGARPSTELLSVLTGGHRRIVAFHSRPADDLGPDVRGHCDVFPTDGAPAAAVTGVFVPGRPSVVADARIADWCAADLDRDPSHSHYCETLVVLHGADGVPVDALEVPAQCGPVVELAALRLFPDHDSLRVTCKGVRDGSYTEGLLLTWRDDGLASVLTAHFGVSWWEPPEDDTHDGCMSEPVGSLVPASSALEPVVRVTRALTESERADGREWSGCEQDGFVSDWAWREGAFHRRGREHLHRRGHLCPCP